MIFNVQDGKEELVFCSIGEVFTTDELTRAIEILADIKVGVAKGLATNNAMHSAFLEKAEKTKEEN